MDTFLLDTNLVSVLYDAGRSNHGAVRAAVAALEPQAPQLVSVVTLAELRLGLTLSREVGRPLSHIEACIERAEEHPPAEIGRFTAQAFAHVKGSVAVARLDIRRQLPRYVEGWTDRITSEKLQIDENDLWLAAQAVERNFVVLTADKDFRDIIAPAVPELRVMLL